MQEIEKLIVSIISAIVKRPEQVVLQTQLVTDEDGTVLKISVFVDPDDMPMCIGAGGVNAEALRRVSTLMYRNAGIVHSVSFRIHSSLRKITG